MISRTTLALLVLFFAGLIGLWWANRAGVPTALERERMAGVVLPGLLDVEPSTIRRVEIEGRGEGGPIVLERAEGDGGPWRLTAPIRAAADQGQVEALVRQLIGLRPLAGTDAIDDPPGRFGLEEPDRTARLFGPGSAGPLAGLDLGKTIDDRRYVRRADGGPIRVVDARRLAALDLPAVDWRQKALFEVPSFEVEGLAFRRPDQTLEARRAGGHWQVVEPFRAPADDAKVDGLAAGLAALRVAGGASSYVADGVRDWSPFGLDQPALTISLDPDGDAPPQVVEIGKEAPDVPGRTYARRADQDNVVLVDSKAVRDLDVAPRALRSRQVARLDPSRADRIAIRAGEVDHVLVLGADGWEVVAPSPGPADLKSVRDLLARVEEAQASEVLDPAGVDDAGLDPPMFSVAIWEGRGQALAPGPAAPAPADEEPLVLEMGKALTLAKSVYVRLAGDSSILVVPDALLRVMPTGPLAFRNLNVLALGQDAIATIRIESEGRSITLQSSAARSPDSWRMIAPFPGPVDPLVASRISVLLGNLRADRLVGDASPGDLGRYGLDAPPLKATFVERPSSGKAVPPTHTLLVGDAIGPKDESRYAKLADEPMVFTIPVLAYSLLLAEPGDRRLAGTLRTDEIERIEARWPRSGPGRSLSAARRPNPGGTEPGWEIDPDSRSAGIGPARVEALARLVAGLHAVRFASHGGPFPAEAGLADPKAEIIIRRAGQADPIRLRLGDRTADGLRFATLAPAQDGPVALLNDADWQSWAAPSGRDADPGPGSAPALPENPFTPAETPAATSP